MFVPAASLVLALIASAIATPGRKVGSVCTKAPYSEILPFSNFPPAETFCSLFFPVKPATTTTTTTPVTTITVPAASPVTKRGTADKSAQWRSCSSALSRSGAGYLSTACSCIETASTVTVTHTARTSTVTMTSAPGACSPLASSSTTVACGSSVYNSILFPQTATSQPSFNDCLISCTGEAQCCAANYDTGTDECYQLLNEQILGGVPCPTSYTVSPNAAYDAVYRS